MRRWNYYCIIYQRFFGHLRSTAVLPTPDRQREFGGQSREGGDLIQHLEFEIADMRSLEKQVGELPAKIYAQENADGHCEVRLHDVPYKEGESLKNFV